jgi:hypothetical protein
MYKLSVVLLVLFITGCGTVRDYDPEKEEIARAKKHKEDTNLYEPTGPIVLVGEKKNISVIVEKIESIRDSEFADRQVWEVSVANTAKEDLCVMLVWKLMDFEYISSEPAKFLVPAHYQKTVGKMISNIWDFNGFRVAPPASGYLYSMEISKPEANALLGEECNTFDKKVNE